ncbi:hypothetical protein ALQ57_05179 [Pseudomonas amygdali pv. hibisci]|nr:hypothetical protein ALQ57_05179 [Pseudomonas amygdali pv. hibisci]
MPQVVNPDGQIAWESGAKVFLLPKFRRAHRCLFPSKVFHPVHARFHLAAYALCRCSRLPVSGGAGSYRIPKGGVS